MRISTRRLAVAVLAAAIVAAPSAASAANSSTATAAVPSPSQPAGHIGGVIPVRGDAKSASHTSGGSNLSYHNGPVMLSNTVYTIYWEPGAAGTSMVSGYQSVIDGFFSNVAAAGAATSTSNVYAIDTQYGNSTTKISYSWNFGGSFVDTSSLPANACSDSVTKSYCLSDAQIQAEIQKDLATSGWSSGSLPAASPTNLFMMLTPQNVGSCTSSSSCAFTQYCAYHGYFGSGTQTVYYANMPYAGTDPSACGTGQSPNTNPDADSEINILSHEHNEAITDEHLSAWYDRRGYEIGDKCAWNFGSSLGTTTSGAEYNQVINGNPYYLQQEWSNQSSGCALHM